MAIPVQLFFEGMRLLDMARDIVVTVRPITKTEVDDLIKTVEMHKRMRAAHNKGQCWKACRHHPKLGIEHSANQW